MKLADTFTDLASAAGVGAVARLAGTAAMTISSTIESRLRHREPSDTPAEAAGTASASPPKTKKAKPGSAPSLTGLMGPGGAQFAVCWT